MKFSFDMPLMAVDGKPYVQKNKKSIIAHNLSDQLAYFLARQPRLPDPVRFFEIAQALQKHELIELTEDERDLIVQRVKDDISLPLFVAAQFVKVLETPKE